MLKVILFQTEQYNQAYEVSTSPSLFQVTKGKHGSAWVTRPPFGKQSMPLLIYEWIVILSW